MIVIVDSYNSQLRLHISPNKRDEMYSIGRFLALSALLVICSINSVFAHHASAPHYDGNTEVLIKDAVITEFKMVNPHSFIYFDAPGMDGEIANWRCESRPASVLRRLGWTEETFYPGQKVSVEGSPAWREDNVCLMSGIVLADGTKIGPRTNFTNESNNQTAALASDNESKGRSLAITNGQPNISGDWVSLSFERNGLGGGSDEPNNGFDPSEANITAAATYDVRFDDPSLHCHPINIIQGWNHDRHVNRITQLNDRVILTYGYVDFVRTIYLDVEHPAQIEPSTRGHSIGTWEENVLMVDTIGFLPGALSHRIGIMHSSQMHITERFYYDETSNELVRDYVVEDSLYLNTPYINQDRQGASAEPHSSYNCEDLSGENNLRPDIYKR